MLTLYFKANLIKLRLPFLFVFIISFFDLEVAGSHAQFIIVLILCLLNNFSKLLMLLISTFSMPLRGISNFKNLIFFFF